MTKRFTRCILKIIIPFIIIINYGLYDYKIKTKKELYFSLILICIDFFFLGINFYHYKAMNKINVLFKDNYFNKKNTHKKFDIYILGYFFCFGELIRIILCLYIIIIKYINKEYENINKYVNEENAKDEKYISIRFDSNDQKIARSFACKEEDKFKIYIIKLLEDFPEYNKKKVYFLSNGNIIDENKTLKENNIKDITLTLDELDD